MSPSLPNVDLAFVHPLTTHHAANLRDAKKPSKSLVLGDTPREAAEFRGHSRLRLSDKVPRVRRERCSVSECASGENFRVLPPLSASSTGCSCASA